MFTGLVETTGTVRSLEKKGGQARLEIDCPFAASLTLGESVAVNGCCLTVSEFNTETAHFDILAQTLSVTSLGSLQTGSTVNLERALRVGDELGGHIVSGHVDGLAEITETRDEGDSTRFTFRAPQGLARFIAPKGSVALNGTSLTVNEVDGTTFGVNIIPHTKIATTWGAAQPGDQINLEIDTLARYVARLAEAT